MWREGKGVEWRSFIEAQLAQHPAPCGLLQNEGTNFRIKTNRGKHGVDKETVSFRSAPHQSAPQAEMEWEDKPAQARRLVLHYSETGSAWDFPFPALPFCPAFIPTAGLVLSGCTFCHTLTVKPTAERRHTVRNTKSLVFWERQHKNKYGHKQLGQPSLIYLGAHSSTAVLDSLGIRDKTTISIQPPNYMLVI